MIQYILECIAFQLVFLIIYDLFLKRETFFQWNRFYLICTFVLSLIIPWVKIEAMKAPMPRAFQGYPEYLWYLDQAPVVVKQAPASDGQLSWPYLLVYLGMFLAALVFAYKLYQIEALKRSGKKQVFRDFTQYVIANSNAAFSFFKAIFLGDQVVGKEHQSIVRHELVHIRQKHSYDLLFFELMRIVGWFDPMVYLYQNRISELHEFIADAQVAKTNKKEQYQLLLSEVFQTQNISFINQFFKSSLIKKRIVMLTKEKSKQVWQLKYLLLVPIVMGMLAYTSSEKSFNTQNAIKVTDTGRLTSEEETVVLAELLRLSEGPDGWEFFVKDENSTLRFVKSDNGSYLFGPNGEKIYAKLAIHSKLNPSEAGDINTWFEQLIQNKEDAAVQLNTMLSQTDQSIDKLKRVNEMTLQYNELVKERERLLQSTNEKNPVIVNLDNQLAGLKKAIAKTQGITMAQETEIPFAIVDQVPTFPGCENEPDQRACFLQMMQKHIAKNFTYPKEAQEKGIQGRVNIIFTIAQDGSIQNARFRGPDPLLENEAKRIIALLPQMVPGKQEGKAVNVLYSIPITFKLEGDFHDFSEIRGKDGQGEPLVFVNGELSSIVEFRRFNPDSIKFMNVLKGKGAIDKYGEKAINGAIEIETKSFKAKGASNTNARLKEEGKTAEVALKKLSLKVSTKTKGGKKFIYGEVMGVDRIGLPGVNISVDQEKVNTFTDFDGLFEMEANEGDIIYFRYIGYERLGLKITDQESYSVNR